MRILKTLCAAVGLVLALFAACDPARQQQTVDNRSLESTPAIDEQQLLDDTFRIDIQTIEVTFDYFPEQSYVHGRAEVTFQMRPGQTQPLIHFDPAVRGQPPHLIRLDGEVLDFADPADVRIVEFDGSSQKALEFQRHPAENMDHTIEMTYRLDSPQGYPRFSPDVSDIEGTGNEEIFPTLNTPHELARHRIFINVHGSSPFRCLGSGLVEPVSGPVQGWVLDSEREVASYTLFFVVVPADDVQYRTRTINGVAVRVMAFIGGASIDEAFAALESWLPELEADLGPFPMPRGLSIFLTHFGGGMEFYGGTITSLSVLEHEVFHMYFGCSTVAKTFRDSWWDEAINMWYEYSVDPEFTPIPENYRSNIVGGRSPIAVGFDRRAYDEGARIFQAVAVELGGRGAMIGFLRYLHQNYTFAPFTTIDLLDYLEDYAGVDMHDRFIDWLYNGDRTYYAAVSTSSSPPLPQGRKVDLTPPEAILKKYTHRQARERQH
jgi:aminopeptidase N